MTDGEIWVDELLAELRARGYGLRAWQTLLARSLARSAEVRAEHGRARRQLLALAILGAAAWAVVPLTGPPWLALAGASWLALLLLMADWHLGMLDGAATLGAANVLSLARGALVPAFFVVPAGALAVLLLLAGAGDVLDGPLARARGEESRLGRWLDGSADGLVLASAAISLGRLGLLAWGVVALVLARPAVQWSALALAYLRYGLRPENKRPASGKAAGVVLFLGLLLSAFGAPGGALLAATGALGGLGTLLLSAHRSLRPAASQ